MLKIKANMELTHANSPWGLAPFSPHEAIVCKLNQLERQYASAEGNPYRSDLYAPEKPNGIRPKLGVRGN